MTETVLVANRGEIACRILRTVRRLGLRAVAVYADDDVAASHVRLADEAHHVTSYLDVAAVLAAARAAGADALHPGYGFLSEDAHLARSCAEAGIVFVGPPAEAIAAMGDKIAAKQAVEAAGVPVVPGVHRADLDDEALRAAAEEVGFPLLVKAAAGGGGRGMRAVAVPAELTAALTSARREASASFGSDALLLERLVEAPRHVEVQVLADTAGHVIGVGERECTLQRRHQKLIEECPSPWASASTRAAMTEAAVAAARACQYVGAGTIEFLVDPERGEFYFLEMNTRLQVEHPVTEEVYGLDLVAWQIEIAAGRSLTELGAPQPRGHAVEARVYAEDPARGFLPTGGQVAGLRWPPGSGVGGRDLPRTSTVRVDGGIEVDTVVGTRYDPLLAKVIAWGADRPTALRRLRQALGEVTLLGVTTNITFLRQLLGDADVVAGRLDTGLVERVASDLAAPSVPDDVLAAAALERMCALEPEPDGRALSRFEIPDGWRVGNPSPTSWHIRVADRVEEVAVRGRAANAAVQVGQAPPRTASARWEEGALSVTLDGHQRRYELAEGWIGREGQSWPVEAGDELAAARTAEAAATHGPVTAPMPGTIIAVEVRAGEHVRRGQPLVVVEAMKMEHPVTATGDGVVESVRAVGTQVAMGEVLAVIVPDVAG